MTFKLLKLARTDCHSRNCRFVHTLQLRVSDTSQIYDKVTTGLLLDIFVSHTTGDLFPQCHRIANIQWFQSSYNVPFILSECSDLLNTRSDCIVCYTNKWVYLSQACTRTLHGCCAKARLISKIIQIAPLAGVYAQAYTQAATLMAAPLNTVVLLK